MASTIGVAIASYNGMRYIEEQLDSIARQTVPPALISVSDDCSTDGTWEFLQNYKRKSPIPMVLNSNARQLGVLENFILAFRQCDTDYIAYCDQDDVWDERKIATCGAALSRGDISLVFHRSTIVDAQLRSLGRFAPANIRGGIYPAPHFPDMLWGFGHQMIFSRDVLDILDAIRFSPVPEIAIIGGCFDYSLLVAAGFIGNIYFIEEELMKFRRHNNSVSPAEKNLPLNDAVGQQDLREYRIRSMSDTLAVVLSELLKKNFQPTKNSDVLNRNIKHLHELSLRYARRRVLYESKKMSDRLRAWTALLNSGAYGSVKSNKLPPRQLLLDGGRAVAGKNLARFAG